LPDPALGVSTWYAFPYNGERSVITAACRRTDVSGFGSHALPPCARMREGKHRATCAS
jgi:hypothetical protein